MYPADTHLSRARYLDTRVSEYTVFFSQISMIDFSNDNKQRTSISTEKKALLDICNYNRTVKDLQSGEPFF